MARKEGRRLGATAEVMRRAVDHQDRRKLQGRGLYHKGTQTRIQI